MYYLLFPQPWICRIGQLQSEKKSFILKAVDLAVSTQNTRSADDLSHLTLSDSRAPPRPLTLPPLLPPLPSGPPPPPSSDKRPMPPTPTMSKSPAPKRGCGVSGEPQVVGRGRGRRLVYPRESWQVGATPSKPALEVILDDLTKPPPPPPVPKEQVYIFITYNYIDQNFLFVHNKY